MDNGPGSSHPALFHHGELAQRGWPALACVVHALGKYGCLSVVGLNARRK